MNRWQKWQEQLIQSSFVKKATAMAKSIHPPGFRGLSLFFVGKYLVNGIFNGAITTRSSAISFRMFLSFFPAMALLVTVLNYVHIDGFQENLFQSIEQVIPPKAYQFIDEALADVESHSSGVISISFIVGLFLASNTVNSILLGFNGSINLERSGNIFIIRLMSVGILIVFGIIIAAAVLAIGFSDVILEYFQDKNLMSEEWLGIGFQLLKWSLAISLIYFSIAILYNFGDLQHKKWSTFTAGTSFTTVVFILSSAVFSWFIETFLNYDAIYGSIGSLLVLLVWINFNNTVLLLGFELNTSIYRAQGVASKLETA